MISILLATLLGVVQQAAGHDDGSLAVGHVALDGEVEAVDLVGDGQAAEIGRASCRERVFLDV